jgi:hypothetical protein
MTKPYPLNGRIYTYFKKINVSNTEWTQIYTDIITFTTAGVMMLNESSTGIVQVSLNGKDSGILCELNSSLPSRGMSFDNIVISQFWLRIAPTSPLPNCVISVSAWGER